MTAAPARPAATHWIALAALLAVVLVIDVWRLGEAPAHLAHDEVVFALNAHSLSTTGRTLDGHMLPLYVHVSGSYWLTAMPMYLGALLMKAMRLSDTVVRLPSVLVGLAGIALMYLVALRLFHRAGLALVAAGLLAITPAYFIHSRLGVDHLYPVPFVLAWMLSLLHASAGRTRAFLLSAAFLGAGVYSYLGSAITMPVLLVLTCAFIWFTTEKPIGIIAAAIAVFALALLPLAISLGTNPTQFTDHVRMYSLYDPSRFTPLQGVKEVLSYTSLTARTDVYWGYFSPSFLFFSGDASLIDSTRAAGVLLLVMVVLLPLGIYRIVHVNRTPFEWLLLAAFAAAPIAAVVVGEPNRVNRALVMLPIVALISTIGLASLVDARRLPRTALAALLVGLALLQFRSFYRDYLGDYRVRSSGWFERNIKGALEAAIDSDHERPAPAVFLSTAIPYIEYYWKLYLIENGSEMLLPRTHYVELSTVDVATVAADSLLVGDAADATLNGMAQRGQARFVATAAEPNGTPSFGVFRWGQ